jgi:Leucine-rich repeat (LRR) protein
MKNLYYIIGLLLITYLSNAQIVNIPDANFKLKLLNYSPPIDTNNDGDIQTAEALAVGTLVIEGVQITDLTGIQSFGNLTSLTARYLPITTLNVSGLTNLQTLNCSSNYYLNSLNLTGLVNLQTLNCYDCDAMTTLNLSGLSNLNNLNASDVNELTSLDLSNLPNLQIVNISSCRNLNSSPNFSGSLAIQNINASNCNRMNSLNLTGLLNLQTVNCSNCDLATLDASNLPNLTFLNCSFNENSGPGSPNTLTSINISGSNALTQLICSFNALTNLDIANHTNLNYLECSQNQLTSLPISNLTNLTFLSCSSNNLTSLDIGNLTNLNILSCTDNQISSLAISNLVNLTQLDCSQNQLTVLDVAPLLQLTELRCSFNQISSLNLLPLTQLTVFSADGNPLNTLNVSTLTNLIELHCTNCQLNSIDVTNLMSLRHLSCSGNPITSIDVSDQPNLRSLRCSNTLVSEIDLSHISPPVAPQFGNFVFHLGYNPNLNYINLKNGVNYLYNSLTFSAGDCPNLTFICTDEQSINPLKFSLNGNSGGPMGTININLIQFNSYCTFTPGGTYNTISGTVSLDGNNNGCDVNDIKPSNLKVTIDDGNQSGATFTNNVGNFSFFTQSGNFTVAPVFENTYFTVTPAGATMSFPSLDGSTQTQNFCIIPNGIHNDVDIAILPLNSPRPGFDSHYTLVYKNKGNQIVSGMITFNFDDAVQDFISANPNTTSQSVSTLSWNYTNLFPFESRSINFTLNVNSPMETPAVNIDDILSFSALVNPTSGDETPEDNLFNLNQTVIGSYDPNDKTCIEGETIPPSKVGDYLNYLIRFQNSGTAPAENVVIKDQIDTTKFDLASLQLTGTSHPQVTRITGNIVEFIFENIQLPAEQDDEPGSHGYVAFKIRTKNNLVLGNTVSNTADIYFDYNFPIVTNTATTTIAVLANNEVENTSVYIAPNPVKNNLVISANDVITSIQIYDVQGRLIATQINNSASTTLDMSQQNEGVYFVKVITENGVKAEKIIKE